MLVVLLRDIFTVYNTVLQTFEEDDGDQGELDENETEDIEDKG